MHLPIAVSSQRNASKRYCSWLVQVHTSVGPALCARFCHGASSQTRFRNLAEGAPKCLVSCAVDATTITAGVRVSLSIKLWSNIMFECQGAVLRAEQNIPGPVKTGGIQTVVSLVARFGGAGLYYHRSGVRGWPCLPSLTCLRYVSGHSDDNDAFHVGIS